MIVLAEPMVRLVYERGEFDAESTALTADALFWFAFSLPFSGFVLMLTRGFFSLQRPWLPTKLAVGSLAINAVGSYLLAERYGIGGIVLGTIVSNAALVIAEAIWLRQRAGRVRDVPDARRDRPDDLRGGGPGAWSATSAWLWLDDALGRSLPAQIVSLGTALALGGAAYAGIVLAWQIPEARQIFDLFARRLRKRS